MPWQCQNPACGTLVPLDTIKACPACNAEKSAWSIAVDRTRALVVPTGKRLDCRRGRLLSTAPAQHHGVAWLATTEASVVGTAQARALADQRRLPDPYDVLSVRLRPPRGKPWKLDVAIAYETRKLEGRTMVFEPLEDALDDEGMFAVHFLCVAGPEPADEVRFPFVHVLDVTEESELGHAPRLEVAAFGGKKVPITLARRAPGRRRLELLELQDALFRLDGALLMPEGDEPEGAGSEAPDRPPTTVGLVARALSHLQAHPEKKVLVAGHTDTTGSVQHNQPLSELRARCGHAVLMGDREAFVGIALERSHTADLQQVLRWVGVHLGWPVDPGPVDGMHGPRTSKAVRDFQGAYNERDHAGNPQGEDLVVDGLVGPATWGALFDCYELATRQALGLDAPGLAALRARVQLLDPATPFVGCSEHHPIEAVGVDNYRSETNRRVELLFFEPGEEPAVPLACHAGGRCEPTRCEVYDRARYDRRPLPLVEEWTARWEGEARTGAAATMVLQAPGLAAGTPVTYRVLQDGERELATIEALAEAGRCAAPFDGWYAPALVREEERVRQHDEPFPQVTFTFVASADGREARSEPAPFRDFFEAEVAFAGGGKAVGREVVLHTPWGAKRARSDAEGVVRVEPLPPGGVQRVVIGGTAMRARKEA